MSVVKLSFYGSKNKATTTLNLIVVIFQRPGHDWTLSTGLAPLEKKFNSFAFSFSGCTSCVTSRSSIQISIGNSRSLIWGSSPVHNSKEMGRGQREKQACRRQYCCCFEISPAGRLTRIYEHWCFSIQEGQKQIKTMSPAS
jgi:hypothetical protein